MVNKIYSYNLHVAGHEHEKYLCQSLIYGEIPVWKLCLKCIKMIIQVIINLYNHI